MIPSQSAVSGIECCRVSYDLPVNFSCRGHSRITQLRYAGCPSQQVVIAAEKVCRQHQRSELASADLATAQRHRCSARRQDAVQPGINPLNASSEIVALDERDRHRIALPKRAARSDIQVDAIAAAAIPDHETEINFGGGCAYLFECDCAGGTGKFLWQN